MTIKTLAVTERLCNKRIRRLTKRKKRDDSCKDLQTLNKKFKEKLISSEYGSVTSDKEQISNSSKWYGISPSTKDFNKLKFQHKSKRKLTKLSFFDKSEGSVIDPADRLKNEELINNFMKKRSSTQSEDSKRQRNMSESSLSSTNSVVYMKRKTESIEGLHTFNLKQVPMHSRNSSESSFSAKSNYSSKHRSTSRSLYIEEKVHINEKSLKQTYCQSLLKEWNRIVKEFQIITSMNAEHRQQYFNERVGAKRRAKISFSNEDEINKIKSDQSYKVNERNALGVKSSEGWVYNLNIGNIMHLMPLDYDDMHLALLPETIKKKSMNELSKDMIIEKIVYLTVSMFWVGTEYRFLYSKTDQDKYDKKESEIWHAKSLHIWSTFLPVKSPLLSHITKSYIKHHLKYKIEAQEKLKAQTKKSEEVKQITTKTEPKITHRKAPAQTPEPELSNPRLTEEPCKVKKRHVLLRKFKNVIEDRHAVLKPSTKLVPSFSKCDMIKTSKLVFNLDLVPKKKPKSKCFSFLIPYR